MCSLPDCQQPIPSEGHGKIKNEGFWSASLIWHPPIFSSFQCWPKACEQPVPPIIYAVDATATFTCAHGPTMAPVGFTPGKYKIVVSSGLTTTLPSSTIRIPSSTHMDSSSFTATTTTTMYTVYSAVQSTVTPAPSSAHVSATFPYTPLGAQQSACENAGGTNC